MKKLFPHTLWNRDTTSLLGCAASKFIVFDIIWCLQTTFTSFSLPEVYVNSLLTALLFILPFMLTGKKWLEYIVLFILDGLLISNLMYCRTYNSMIPLESYLLASNLSDFTASVIDSMRWIDALLPLSTLICIYSLHKRKNRGAEASGRERGAYALRIKQYALTTLSAFLLSVILIFAKGGPEKAFNNLDNANMYTCKVPMYTIFGNLIHEANQQKTVFTPKIKAEIDNWMKHQPAYQPLADSIARKKTLVVIFCESLESWEINRKVEGKEITPNLNRYIADSHTLYAPHVLTQVKGGRSIDGQLLVSTGLLPLMSGCYAMQFPFTHYPSLVKAMKEEHPDLSSYLMTVDKSITWNQSVVAENFGISQMFFNDQWVNDEKVGSRKKLGDYPEKMRDFMIMANYTDHGLGILLDYLKSRPDYKDMMIVIIGDHEGLAADRKPICESPAAKGIVSDKQFTPFIVVNAPVGGIYNKVMGQVDQYPTILNLMHLDHYKWKGMGQSIFDPRKYPAAVGSDNMNVETTGNVPEKEIKRLTQAHRISDFLIRYDKIIK